MLLIAKKDFQPIVVPKRDFLVRANARSSDVQDSEASKIAEALIDTGASKDAYNFNET